MCAAPTPEATGAPEGDEPFDLDREMNAFHNAAQDDDDTAGEIAQTAIYDEFARLRATVAALTADRASARLAALTEVHEFYEFDATTEEQFDAWLHARIKEHRAQLGLGAAEAKVADLECTPLVLLTQRLAYAKALVDAQLCDAAEAERRALRTYPSPGGTVP